MLKWHYGSVKILAVAGLVAGALTTANPEAAAAPAWKIANSPNVRIPGGQIDSMSCSAPDACTAVGSDLGGNGINVTLAERWNGKAWKRQPTPNPAEDSAPGVRPNLLGVSCPADNFCLAVGTYLLSSFVISFAETWDGKKWTEHPISVPAGSDIGGLDGVSCLSASFCTAVGSDATPIGGGTLTLAATWNGKGWHVQATPNPVSNSGNLSGVSCVTVKFCEAVGTSDSQPPDFAEQWNGTSWKLQSAPAGSAGAGRAKSVACVSVKFCEAVGSAGLADSWRGRSWKAQKAPSSNVSLTGVSCVSATFCEAVGAAGGGGGQVSAAIRWNGTGWAAQSTPQPASAQTALDAVACASAKSCEAEGSSAPAGSFDATAAVLAQAWNGKSWKLQPAVSPASAVRNVLSAVSCVSASFCEAVGSRDDGAGNQVALAERWTGTAWVLQTVPGPPGQSGPSDDPLQGVSCVSATFCEAVGSSAEQWDGTSWKAQSRPGGGVQPQSVSCVSVSFCMAVNGFGAVTLWNGSAWSADSSVTGFPDVGSVSCASATDCEVVGEGPTNSQSAAKWDGSSWTPQTTPGPPNAGLDAISCPATDACEAVGSVNGQNQTTLAEVWDGSAWTVQNSPTPVPAVVAQFQSVWCSAANSCAAVGQFEYTNETPRRALAEVWNGKSWSLRSALDPLDTGSSLEGVSCVPGKPASQCVAVGQAPDVGGVVSTFIATGS